MFGHHQSVTRSFHLIEYSWLKKFQLINLTWRILTSKKQCFFFPKTFAVNLFIPFWMKNVEKKFFTFNVNPSKNRVHWNIEWKKESFFSGVKYCYFYIFRVCKWRYCSECVDVLLFFYSRIFFFFLSFFCSLILKVSFLFLFLVRLFGRTFIHDAFEWQLTTTVILTVPICVSHVIQLLQNQPTNQPTDQVTDWQTKTTAQFTHILR